MGGNSQYSNRGAGPDHQRDTQLQSGPRRSPSSDPRGWSRQQLHMEEHTREKTSRTLPKEDQHREWRGGYIQAAPPERRRQRPAVPDGAHDRGDWGGYTSGYSVANAGVGGREMYAFERDSRSMPTGLEQSEPMARSRKPREDITHRREGGPQRSWVDDNDTEPTPHGTYTRRSSGPGRSEKKSMWGRQFGGEEHSLGYRTQEDYNVGAGDVERAWRGGGGGEYRGSQLEHPAGGGQGRGYEYSEPANGPGGASQRTVPATGGSTRASFMHNPVDPEELARAKAKKDAYRRDLEAQVTREEEGRRIIFGLGGGAKSSENTETTHL